MIKLNSQQMAKFVAEGYLRFDGVVPRALNEQLLARFQSVDPSHHGNLRDYYHEAVDQRVLPIGASGLPLDQVFDAEPLFCALLAVPEIEGAICSLLGEAPRFDHHFLHVTLTPETRTRMQLPAAAQHNHQDSTIDPDLAFDIQLFYFPQAVTEAMGGTRFLPGSHLRTVSEAAIARYQNIVGQQHVVCPAGSVFIFHKGLWHGGGLNTSQMMRYLYKIRLAPGGSQVRQWDTSDLAPIDDRQGPTFWREAGGGSVVQQILMRPQPWFEYDVGRLELINRIKLWRYLLGDPAADVDYWLTRLERPQLIDRGASL